MLIISPGIIRELADVLRNDLKWPEPDIVAQLKLIARVATVAQAKIPLKVVATDSDDDRIFECAVAGNADLIVSYDSPRHANQSLSWHRDCEAVRIPQNARGEFVIRQGVRFGPIHLP